MRTIIGIGVGSLLTLSAMVMGQAHGQGQDPGHGRVDIPAWVVRPCAGPDQVNCRWTPTRHWIANHPHMGGWDHVSVRRQIPNGNHMVCEYYADRAYAKHHDFCA